MIRRRKHKITLPINHLLAKGKTGIKYVISLDVALRNTGVAVHDNTGVLVESFNIATKNGMNDHDSIDYIVKTLFDKLDCYCTLELSPHVVVYVEDIIFARQGKSTSRAEVAGVIKWNFRQQGVMMYGVTPSAWESYLFGRYGMKPVRLGGGRVRSEDIKRCTMEVLHRHCNFYTDNDNIADAVGIGKFGLAHSIEKKRLSVRALARIV